MRMGRVMGAALLGGRFWRRLIPMSNLPRMNALVGSCSSLILKNQLMADRDDLMVLAFFPALWRDETYKDKQLDGQERRGAGRDSRKTVNLLHSLAYLQIV